MRAEMAALRRCALIWAVFIVLALSSATSLQDNKTEEDTSQWESECFRLRGSISINIDEVVGKIPPNATVKSFCGKNKVFELHWEDEMLQFFLREKETTFQIDELHYMKGKNAWIVSNMRGIVGVVNGEVACSHKTLELEYFPQNEGPSKTCLKLNSPRVENTENDTIPAESTSLPTASSTSRDPEENNGDSGIATEATNLGDNSDTELASEAPQNNEPIASPEDNISEELCTGYENEGSKDPPENRIRVVLDGFSLWYKSTTPPVSQPKYQSSCRVEPDLTITLAVSGGVTGAALVVAAAAASRVFC